MISLAKVRLSLQILALFILYNYSATWMAQGYNQLMGIQSLDDKDNRVGWSSMIVLIMIQKMGVFGLSVSSLVISTKINNHNRSRLQKFPSNESENYETQKINETRKETNEQLNRTSDNQEAIKQLKITFQQEAKLGFLLFSSIIVFSSLQSNVNIVYILIQKCLGCWIVCFKLVFIEGRSISRSKYLSFICFTAAMALSCGVKVAFNEILSFYNSQLGAIGQELSLQGFLEFIAMIVLDIALYSQFQKFSNSGQQSDSNGNKSYPKTLRSLGRTLRVLFSTTKYCIICLCIAGLIQGQLVASFSFIKLHPTVLLVLSELAIFYFINQVVLFYTLIKYSFTIFMLLLLTNGAWTKMMFYFSKSFEVHSLIFLILIVCVIAAVESQIYGLTEKQQKNESSQTLTKQKPNKASE